MVTHKSTSRLFSALAKLLSRPSLRPVVRLGTDAHVFLYRLTGGKAQLAKYPTMLLTTVGRKTGQLRTVPLIYIADGGRFIIAAAYAGSAKNPTWWLNLQHRKEALIHVMRTTVRVRAALVSSEERARYWQVLVAMYPYFTEYQARTQREIPIIVLTPVEREACAQAGAEHQ